MIIKPYVINLEGVHEFLAQREIRVNSENYAICRYKKRLHYVAEDFQILIREKSPDQNDYRFVNSLEGINFFSPKSTLASTELDRPKSALEFPQKNIPSAEFLFKFAEMGLDRAVVLLRYMGESEEDYKRFYEHAVGTRPRYSLIAQMAPDDLSQKVKTAMQLSAIINQLPSKFLAYPLNSAHFKKMIAQGPSFRVEKYFQEDFRNLGFGGKLSRTTAKKYLDANIFFHNSIFNESPESFVEKCTLEYEENIDNSTLRSSAFTIKTKDYYNTVATWRNQTITMLKDLSSEVLRRLQRDRKISEHASVDEKFMENLSVYCIAAVRFESDSTRRVRLLHKVGLRQLGHIESIRDTNNTR